MYVFMLAPWSQGRKMLSTQSTGQSWTCFLLLTTHTTRQSRQRLGYLHCLGHTSRGFSLRDSKNLIESTHFYNYTGSGNPWLLVFMLAHRNKGAQRCCSTHTTGQKQEMSKLGNPTSPGRVNHAPYQSPGKKKGWAIFPLVWACFIGSRAYFLHEKQVKTLTRL